MARFTVALAAATAAVVATGALAHSDHADMLTCGEMEDMFADRVMHEFNMDHPENVTDVYLDSLTCDVDGFVAAIGNSTYDFITSDFEHDTCHAGNMTHAARDMDNSTGMESSCYRVICVDGTTYFAHYPMCCSMVTDEDEPHHKCNLVDAFVVGEANGDDDDDDGNAAATLSLAPLALIGAVVVGLGRN